MAGAIEPCGHAQSLPERPGSGNRHARQRRQGMTVLRKHIPLTGGQPGVLQPVEDAGQLAWIEPGAVSQIDAAQLRQCRERRERHPVRARQPDPGQRRVVGQTGHVDIRSAQ